MSKKINELKKVFGLVPFNREFYKLKAELQKQNLENTTEIIINIMYSNEFKNETATF